ncbi:MAG: histidine phosphatase family protein [Tistlia sp.]|uniref:histidine phosphatase family protein n=1 Tax=Tistlia sp. TaxID=3057121 RepID=UPI0034A45AF7
MRRLCVLIAALLVASLASATPEAGQEALWRALAGGVHLVLLRHAEAPGTGDPAGFQIDDCATQRNLDEAGRAQARRIGARFRDQGIERARVFTSRWCRSRETAELLGLGPVEELAPLDSFFGERASEAARSEATLAFLAGLPAGAPVVLVTHQVNITALTGVFPRSGEAVVARLEPDGDLAVVGRLAPPD